MPDKKNSPWLEKPMPDHVQAADLPEEVYDQKIEDDDEKIERAITAARLIETPVPPEPQWKVCWACGNTVPLRFRDPGTGVLVCRACLWIGVQQDFYEKCEGLFGGIGGYLQVAAGGGDDEDEDEPAFMEGPNEPDDEEAPEVPQDNSPSMVESAGGPPAKGEDEQKEA